MTMRPYIFLPLPMIPSYRGIFFLQAFVWPPLSHRIPFSFLVMSQWKMWAFTHRGRTYCTLNPWKKGLFPHGNEKEICHRRRREKISPWPNTWEETGRGRNPCVISYLSLSLSLLLPQSGYDCGWTEYWVRILLAQACNTLLPHRSDKRSKREKWSRPKGSTQVKKKNPKVQ